MFLTQQLGGGGAERLTTTLASSLCDRGFQCEITTLFHRDGNSLNSEIATHCVDHKGPISTLRTIRRIDSIFNSSKPDIVITDGRYLGQFVGQALTAGGPKWVSHFGNEFYNARNHLRERIGRLWFAKVGNKANRIVCNSRGGLSEIEHLFPHWKSKLSRIPNAFRLPGPQANPGSRQRRNVIWVGRMVPGKCPLLFVDAIEKLANIPAMREQLSATMCGDGPLLEKIRDEIKRRQLGNVLSAPGFCTDITERLCQSDLMVFTSRSEGLPYALLEAQGVGLAVVSTDCPHGPKEIISDSTGVLVPVDDLDAIVNSVHSLLRVPDRLVEMGNAARKRIAKEFDHDLVVDKWCELLREIE
ncbi:glycosyltransferase [Rubripirellula amarantea]|nr:glycosyltransferase [Rubripirellula amarantea]